MKRNNVVEFQNEFSSLFEYGNQKIGISNLLIQKLKNIINTYDNANFYSTEKIDEFLLFLTESAPFFEEESFKNDDIKLTKDFIIYNKRDLYYANMASYQNLGQSVYNKCAFSFIESYQFVVECLIRLNTELTFPNTVCPFEDFEEHLLATYHIVYYYFKETRESVFIKKIIIALYLINLKYLDIISTQAIISY